jgi:glycosyltransferase involved in cell wall biosynthesis
LTKILIGPAHPLRGGIADFNQALSLAYNSLGTKNKIFTFSLQYPKFLFPGKTQLAQGEKAQNLNIEVCINSINPFSWFKTAKKIAKEKPEYIVIHYWMPFMAPCLGTIARQIKKRTNAKVIGLMHNVIPHESFPFANMLTKYFVKSCDGFITMSKAVLSDLNQFTDTTNKKFSPHPIYNIFGDKVEKSEALNKLNLSSEFKYMLFFGIIRRYKGLDLLLRAMADSKLRNKKIKLIVAGEFYEDRSYYDQIIDDLKLNDKIIFTNGFIPNSNVKNYFGAADIVAQTYKTATQSGVTQIAYHFERPMLVTNVGGLSEIVPNEKVGYVTETNPESIAKALNKFFDENKEYEFSKNTASEKDKFSWDKLIDAIEELV